MSWFTGKDIDPELVAAYFDGEFEGRDELDSLRRRVENWLRTNPEARAQLAAYRRLRQHWQRTSPAEPSSRKWDDALSRLRCRVGEAPPHKAKHRSGAVLWLLGATAACLALVWLSWPGPDRVRPSPKVDEVVTVQEDADDSPWAVASAEEIVILAVEGADTGSLVVGDPPVSGPLEMAGKDDVRVTNMQPDQRDNMVPRVRGNRPMIWATLASERND
jgi:anti-sigma factor RsiW